MDIVKMVNDAVEKRREEIINFTQEIIQIPSVVDSDGELPCALAFEKKMREMELEVEVHFEDSRKPNILGSVTGSPGGLKILMNGHLDVVHPGPLDDWDDDPFAGVIKNGRLYGRGAVDMKSGTCTMVMAAGILKSMGLDLLGKLTVSVVSDEEMGAKKGTRYLLREKLINDYDYGINCEATNLERIDITHKGCYQTNLKIFGKAIHGSRPWLGVNAIEKTVDFIVRLRELEKILRERKHPILGQASINVSTIQGGAAFNMVPSRCVIQIDRRIIPGETHESAAREIEEILRELGEKDSNFKAELEPPFNDMPILDIPSDSLIVKALGDSCKEITGKEPYIAGKDAGTDAAWIQQEMGLHMPVFGPGNYLVGSIAANEYIDLEDLVTATKIYILTLVRMLQMPKP